MISLFRKINMFKDLSNESISKIGEIAIGEVYKKGSIIFNQEDDSKGVYFIKSGRIKIYKSSVDGKEHILHILGEGEAFAEVCVFQGTKYPATAKAIEDSEVYLIENLKLEDLIKKDSSIALELIKVMSTRLINISRSIETIALKDAAGKVATIIIRIATEKGIELKNGNLVPIDISRLDMANMVSLTRESFTRALTKLKEEGIVEVNKLGVVLKDVNNMVSRI